MPLEKQPVQFPEGEGRQGVFLLFKVGKKFSPDFFRLILIKCRCPHHISDKFHTLIKKPGKKFSLDAKGVFPVKTGNVPGHVGNGQSQFPGRQLFRGLWH